MLFWHLICSLDYDNHFRDKASDTCLLKSRRAFGPWYDLGGAAGNSAGSSKAFQRWSSFDEVCCCCLVCILRSHQPVCVLHRLQGHGYLNSQHFLWCPLMKDRPWPNQPARGCTPGWGQARPAWRCGGGCPANGEMVTSGKAKKHSTEQLSEIKWHHV